MDEGPKTIWQTIDAAKVPVINLEVKEVREIVWDKLQEPKSQRKLILVIVSIALLLDNMLYMVIVPIIPDYLRYIGAWGEMNEVVQYLPPRKVGNQTIIPTVITYSHDGQDSATGILFASKAIVQLMINPFSGALIDRIGYDLPMMIGLIIMFLSTSVFACGRSYGMLFFARSLQGVGSAFADTSGLAMIADRFTEEAERSQALGIALAFISFGCLVAPPFGGALYQFAGKEVPFLILAFVSLLDGFMLLLVMKPLKQQIKDASKPQEPSTPIWRLLMDPYIAVCAGALMMSNVALAFLEPTISLWMEDNLTTDNWKIGMIWLPAFFPHVFGVIITVKMARLYPQHQWLMAACGLALEGLCCFIIPFAGSYKQLMIPICGICFGIALIDTALLPTLGYLVDVRYVSVYGSIYAIADISYSFAYAIGPIIAGNVVEAIGFTALNFGIAFSNLLYAPVLIYLKHIYDFKPFESEANILMSDIPDKEYQTYTMQDQKPVQGEMKNHLEYSNIEGNVQESCVDSSEPNRYSSQHGYQNQGASYQQGYQSQQYQGSYQNQQNYQPGYVEQGGNYQGGPSARSVPPPQQARQLPQQPLQGDSNPFRSAQQQQQPPQGGGGDSNPFRRGWKESLFSLPKRWLSTSDENNERDSGHSGDDKNVQLPKLPLPPLDQTISRYMEFLEVLLGPTNPRLATAKQLARTFTAPNGVGAKAQAALERRREEVDNWAYEYWFNDMYMDVRLPVTVNSSPGMVYPPRKFITVHDVAKFAAKIVDGIVDHKQMLDRGDLAVERCTSREKGQPLCMEQFYRILTSYREPGVGRDRLTTLPRPPPETAETKDEHIIVACRNQFYCVAVKAADRGRLTEQEIADQMLLILSEAPGNRPPIPIALLTTADRDTWAKAKEKLSQDDTNRRNFELIAASLCLICLDEPLSQGWVRDASKSHAIRDDTSMLHHIIHGGGSGLNTPNRWFDKTIQIIISNDGTFGMCFEHSPAEATPIIQLSEYLLKKDSKPPLSPKAGPSSHLPPPELLNWNIPSEIEQQIKMAAKDVDRLVEDLDLYVYRYQGYGKDFIKSCRVSPDAYIQLALQLTYYSLYGHLVSTYESASVRRYVNGRVDNIRSASLEALRWTEAMCADKDNQPSRKVSFNLYTEQKKMELFELAVKKQTDTMVQNIMGQGIDNHLLGLREMSKELLNGRLHDFFADDTYKALIYYKLSTSQVATTSDSFIGYGPVVPDGYGASYNPHADTIVFCLSSFNSAEETDTGKFAKALEEALDSMKQLFENNKKE